MRRITIVAAWVLAITAGHYLVSPKHEGVHDLMQRAYYVPIILTGLWIGAKGGTVCAAVVSGFYLPHIFMHWGGVHAGNVEKFLEVGLYLAVGALTGFLADRLRAANAGLQRAYESLREKSAELLLAEENLGRAGRLAALGELSAELAHEIRNPLGSIKGAAEIFCARLKHEDPLREFAVIQVKEADRLDKVLEGCLAVARRRDVPEEPGDIAEAARATVRATAPEASQAGVQVVLEVEDGLPRVQASPDSLRQVFLNLALNAIQAMPSGGRLSIVGSGDKGRIRVLFADTGPGISFEDRERVFEPFFSRRSGGTGLGLAISRRLVAGAGGDLGVNSQPGQGATFVVDLPVAAGVS